MVCKNCKTEYSVNSEVCPNCGATNSTGLPKWMYIGAVVSVIVIVSFVFCLSKGIVFKDYIKVSDETTQQSTTQDNNEETESDKGEMLFPQKEEIVETEPETATSATTRRGSSGSSSNRPATQPETQPETQPLKTEQPKTESSKTKPPATQPPEDETQAQP